MHSSVCHRVLSCVSMNGVSTITDTLVREYLLLRGLYNALKAFDQDAKSGKDLKLQVDKFVADALAAVDNLDIDVLKSIWDLWKAKVFNSLSGENARLTTVYETDMYRLFLVKCMENKRMDKCNQFFLKCASLTQNNPTWAEWFAFPYHPKPEGCQAYRKYYSNEWREIFVISLHNFVRIAIQSAPRSHLVQMIELISEEVEQGNSERSHAVNYGMLNPFEDELMDDFAVIAQYVLWLYFVSSEILFSNYTRLPGRRV
ncbi:hypothetical protein COOONC_19299 [Cooperia oncophora]